MGLFHRGDGASGGEILLAGRAIRETQPLQSSPATSTPNTGPAVLYDLDQLSRGDEIRVHGEDSTTVRYTVDRVEQHARDAFPTEDVYGDTPQPTLQLITCTGSFNEMQGHYQDNLIV